MKPPGRRSVRTTWADVFDRLAGSDPGLNRLRAATQAVVSVGAIIGAEYAFVKITGALQDSVPAGSSAAVAASTTAGNRALLVIAILLGGLLGMLTSLGVNDATAARLAVSTLLVPVPIVASMALGLSLGGHRVAALASFPVVLALGTLARRWGPRGVLIGVPLFIGDFIGFFLFGVVALGDLGWIAAEVGLAAAVSLAVRLVLFFPDPGRALARSQRSWAARASRVAALAALAFDPPAGRDPDVIRAKLRRNLVRLNEAVLIIDAQLAEPEALGDGSSAQRLHERLFDAELGLTNAARFADALGGAGLPPVESALVHAGLDALRAGDLPRSAAGAARILAHLGSTAAEDLGLAGRPIDATRRHQRVLLHRFATSVTLLAGALDEWMAVGAAVGADGRDRSVFAPAVTLNAGWLPGSALVSAQASTEAGRRWHDRIALAPWVRAAVQVGVAVGAATIVGDIISGRRFYWAVIAAFVSFVGANNNLEQARRAVLRVLGTVVGIVIGSLVAQLDGHNDTACIAVVLVALFFGVYLIRVSYAFMVIGVTVIVSQLYEQLGELSNSLLVLRLEETAVGAAIAVATVLVVVPLRTQKVLVVALTSQLRSTARLVEEAIHQLAAPASVVSLAGEVGGSGLEVGDILPELGDALPELGGSRPDLGDSRPGELGGSGPETGDALPGAVLALRARAVDADYQTVLATARPLRHLGDAGRWAQGVVSACTGLRHYARNLATDVPSSGGAGPDETALLERARAHLLGGIDRLIDGYDGGPRTTFVRSASLWSILERHAVDRVRDDVARHQAPSASALPPVPLQHVGLVMAARDLELLDGALAELAALSGWRVSDLDTAPADSPSLETPTPRHPSLRPPPVETLSPETPSIGRPSGE